MYTIKELANALSLTKAQVKYAIKQKRIPTPKKHGFSPLSPYMFTEEQYQEIKKLLKVT